MTNDTTFGNDSQVRNPSVHVELRQRDSDDTQKNVDSHRGYGDVRPMATIDAVRRY